MIPSITTKQMREVDRAMIEDFGIQLVQMMENAGRALATAARVRLGGSAVGRSVLILAGRGNNGGGGLVAARRLANWGAKGHRGGPSTNGTRMHECTMRSLAIRGFVLHSARATAEGRPRMGHECTNAQ